MLKNNCDFNFNEFEYLVYRSLLPNSFEQINHRKNTGMYYILEGEIEIELKNKTITLAKDDYIFFDADESYQMRNPHNNPATIYIIGFSLFNSQSLFVDFEIPRHGTLGTDNVIFSLIQRIFNAWFERKTGYLIKCRSIFHNIIYNILLSANNTNLYLTEYSKLQPAIRYIQTNYSKDIRIDDLCVLSNYSQTHIRRLFIKYFGVSPVKYITKYRIEQSILLFSHNRDLSVNQIAHKCGFNDVCYFSKIFKKVTGYTPLEYKVLNFS